MASLRKKPNSDFWYACFTLPSGTRTQRSTKVLEKKTAQRIADKWEAASRKKITESQARRVISDIYEEIHGQPLTSATFSDYSKQWRERKRGETAPVTFKAYEHALEQFELFLGEKAADQIHYVTVSDIARWRDASAAKASATTANNKLKILRTFFQSAWREGLVPENVAAKVQSLKKEESTRRAFTLDELRSVLAVAGLEWRGMILAGVYTGQRLKDIACLTWSHFEFNAENSTGALRLSTSKTKRNQVIPLAMPLCAYLAGLTRDPDKRAPIFPAAYKIASGMGDISPLSQQFHDLLVSANLVERRSVNKKKSHGNGRAAPRARTEISFHSLRHTATSLLKNAGVSETVARDIIGHDSAEVSRHYTHVDDASKLAAIKLLPDITLPQT